MNNLAILTTKFPALATYNRLARLIVKHGSGNSDLALRIRPGRRKSHHLNLRAPAPRRRDLERGNRPRPLAERSPVRRRQRGGVAEALGAIPHAHVEEHELAQPLPAQDLRPRGVPAVGVDGEPAQRARVRARQRRDAERGGGGVPLAGDDARDEVVRVPRGADASGEALVLEHVGQRREGRVLGARAEVEVQAADAEGGGGEGVVGGPERGAEGVADAGPARARRRVGLAHDERRACCVCCGRLRDVLAHVVPHHAVVRE